VYNGGVFEVKKEIPVSEDSQPDSKGIGSENRRSSSNGVLDTLDCGGHEGAVGFGFRANGMLKNGNPGSMQSLENGTFTLPGRRPTKRKDAANERGRDSSLSHPPPRQEGKLQ